MALKQWRQSKTPNLKPVFSAYLNMARHNCYKSLLHVSKLMQISESNEEENITMFSLWDKLVKGTPTEKLKIIQLLQKHFPMMQGIFDIEKRTNISIATNPKEIKRTLHAFFHVLNSLRNEYTHFSPDPRNTTNDAVIIPYLYRCMDGAAREIKKRFSLTIKKAISLNNEESSQIHDVNKAVEYIFQCDFRKAKVNDLDKNGKIKTKMVDKEDYFYSLKESSETVQDDASKKGNLRKKIVLSDIGIIFFTCLFLEKRYIKNFLDAIKPWPNVFNEIQKKAVFEVFSVFHIHLHREKYDSCRPEYALGLDMLNELQKCPAELFDILSDKDRDRLSVDIHAQGDNIVQNDGVTVKSGKVLMKRMRDRFAPFALQYIDRQNIFKDIRFMVHLGNYRFKFYKKRCLADDGEDTLRTLQKEINGFGRIQEIEMERKKNYSSFFKEATTKVNEYNKNVQELKADTTDSAPYMTNSTAHYLFDGNRVGLRLFNSESDMKSFVPNVKIQGRPATKASEIKLLSPDAWISTYELPGMIFYLRLYKEYMGKTNGYPSAEDILKSYIDAYHRIFDDIKNGTFKGWDDILYQPLTKKDLPIKIKRYIDQPNSTQSAYFHKKSRTRIKIMYYWTLRELKCFDTKLEKMKSKDNKFKKKDYVDLRPGDIAKWLTRDILYFMEDFDEKGTITSANFNSLRSALTLSDTSKEKVYGMISSFKHPFLAKALETYDKEHNEECFRIFDFYRAYLTKRADYLKQIQKIKGNELLKLAFLHSTRKRWKDRGITAIKDLAMTYEQFELPRGIFTPLAKKILVEKCGLSLDTETEKKKLGMANLINFYFESVLKDKNQDFYRWSRHYKIFDLLETNTSKNSQAHNFLLPEQLTTKMRKNKEFEINNLIRNKAKKAIEAEIKYKKNNPTYIDYFNENFKSTTEVAKNILHNAYKNYDDNERILRRYAIQDRLMFLMAKDLLLGIEGIGKGALRSFRLGDIMPNKDKTILDLLVPFTVTLNIDGISVSIRQKDAIKIKRYGEFYRYNSDTRLKSLLPYLIHKVGNKAEINIDIDREELEAELNQYDHERIEIMRKVQSLERSIIAKVGGEKNVEKEIRENFNNLITQKGNIPYERQGKILVNIRNSFCHNEYAKDIDFPENIPLPQIADTIVSLFEAERKNRPKGETM